MGLSLENRPRMLPPEMRGEQAALIIKDRVENVLKHGATIYSNGQFGGFGTAFLKVNGTPISEASGNGIVICKAQDVTPGLYTTGARFLDASQSTPRTALIIPEGSDTRLGYRLDLRGRKRAALLLGVDNKGKPEIDDLFYSYGFLRFFEHMAQIELHKQGVEPNSNTHSYRRSVVQQLEAMALSENGGLGDINKRIDAMKKEMQGTAQEAEKYINGNGKKNLLF